MTRRQEELLGLGIILEVAVFATVGTLSCVHTASRRTTAVPPLERFVTAAAAAVPQAGITEALEARETAEAVEWQFRGLCERGLSEREKDAHRADARQRLGYVPIALEYTLSDECRDRPASGKVLEPILRRETEEELLRRETAYAAGLELAHTLGREVMVFRCRGDDDCLAAYGFAPSWRPRVR